jgi:hypothetical protein
MQRFMKKICDLLLGTGTLDRLADALTPKGEDY